MASSTITLTVKDDGSATIEKLTGKLATMEQQATQGAVRTSGALDTLRQNWIGITAVAAGAGVAINRALAFAERAADQQEALERLTHQLAGTGLAARAMAQDVKDAATGQLSLADAVRLSSQALAQGFNPAQIKTFTQLAEVASDVLGGSIASNFDTLVTSIATGRTSMLKQIGILVDLEAEKKKLADATHRATSEISLMEEKQLLLNAVMQQAPTAMAKVSDGVDTLSDKINRNKAGWTDLFDKIISGATLAGTAILDFNVGVLKTMAPRDRAVSKTSGSETQLLGPLAMMSQEEMGLALRTKHINEQIEALQPLAHWLGVSAESLRVMTDEEKGAFIVRASLRDQLDDLAAETDAYSRILSREADALIASAEASRVAMKVEADHARLLSEETAQVGRLIEATKVLDAARLAESGAFLTRGSPEDAQRRLRQEAFSGTGGDTMGGAQNLLNLAKGIQGGDASDQERLMRDLSALVIQRAQQQASGNQPGVSSAPFGSGSTVIQPSNAGQAFGADVGAFGLRQPVATQPTINITVNGSLAEAGALTRLIRDKIVPELRNVARSGGIE